MNYNIFFLHRVLILIFLREFIQKVKVNKIYENIYYFEATLIYVRWNETV